MGAVRQTAGETRQSQQPADGTALFASYGSIQGRAEDDVRSATNEGPAEMRGADTLRSRSANWDVDGEEATIALGWDASVPLWARKR